MPQLSIDLDSEAIQTGRVPDNARTRKFASRHFVGGTTTRTFYSYRELPYTLTLTLREQRLLLGGDLLEVVQPSDRLLAVIDSRRSREYFQWFDAGALIVEHIVYQADPAFIQTLPFAVPTAIDSEIRALSSDADGRPRWRELAVALLMQMVEKQLLCAPPLLGFADLVRTYGLEGIVLDHEVLDEDVVMRLDNRASRGLQRLLEDAREVLPEASVRFRFGLDEMASAIMLGRPVSLPGASES